VLKEANYDGMISVESPPFTNFEADGARVLEFIKKQWNDA
jgi:sugar phosphate isomerase/epimerase